MPDLEPEQHDNLMEQFRSWYDSAVEGPNYLSADADEIAQVYEDQRRSVQLSAKCCDINVNLFFRICQVIVGKLTDQKQTAEFSPRGDPAKRIMSIIRNEQFRAHWSQYDCDQVWEVATEDAAKLGIGWVKGGYNPEAYRHPQSGKYFQDLVPERVDPHLLLVDPACTKLDLSDAKFIFHLKWMSKRELANIADKSVEDIEADDWDAPEVYDTRWEQEPNEYDQVLAAEIWWKCYETDDDGNLIYPHGRVTIATARHIHADGESPYETSKPHFPFFPIIFIRVPDTVSGVPLGRYLLKAQKWFNALLATIIDNARLTAYVTTYINKASGIKVSSMHNGPGQFIPYNPVQGGAPVHQTVPQPIPVYVERIMDKILFLIEWVSGYVEVSQGRQPGSVRSGRGIEFLRQEADTGLRIYSRRLGYAIKQYARLALYVFSELYEEARVIRLYGITYGKAKEAYEQYKKKLFEQMMVSLIRGEIQQKDMDDVMEDNQLWKGEQYVRKIGEDDVTAYFEVFADGMAYAYDYDIVPDTSSPWSREARDQKGLVLVQNGLPLSLYFKYMADLPMRNEELINELRKLEQQKMQIEMAAQQSKGQAIGPGQVPELAQGTQPMGQEANNQQLAGFLTQG